MDKYSIAKIPTDYSVLKDKINKCEFVCDVAIYFDENATSRKIYNHFSNFDAWLEDYSNRHAIPFFEFRAFVREITKLISKELIESSQDNCVVELNKNYLDQLKEIKGWEDEEREKDTYSYANLLSSIVHYWNVQCNYSIVTRNCDFLTDIVGSPTRFFSEIDINDYGLFVLKSKHIRFYDNPDKFIKRTYIYIYDSEGRHLSLEDFNKLILILENRTGNFGINPFNQLLIELENSIFKVCDHKFRVWITNEGLTPIAWNTERLDGLKFTFESIKIRASTDYATTFEYVRDSKGNQMDLTDFYQGLKMLTNGKKYLKELTTIYLNRQLPTI